MGLVNTVVPLERLEEETVQWCREMLALSPFALRLLKASFNAAEDGLRGHPAARPRRQPAVLRQRGGAGGPRRLQGEAQARLLAVPAPSREPREHRARLSARPHLADGRARAHAARGGRAGARRHLAGARRRARSTRWRSSPRCSARSSSRSARTCRTTTPTRAAAPTPRTASARCASPPAASCRRSQVLLATYVTFGLAVACGAYLVAVAGWELLAVGAASILAGVLYTGGPRPYGYEGLGELFVFLFFGIVAVAGSYFVQVEHLPWEAFVLRRPGRAARQRDPRRQQRARPRDRPARGQAHARGAPRARAHARAVRGDGRRRVPHRAAAVGRSARCRAVAAAPLARDPARRAPSSASCAPAPTGPR